jgi:hypothetical protein
VHGSGDVHVIVTFREPTADTTPSCRVMSDRDGSTIAKPLCSRLFSGSEVIDTDVIPRALDDAARALRETV